MQIRLSEEEKARIEEAARLKGLPASTYLRSLALEDAKRMEAKK